MLYGLGTRQDVKAGLAALVRAYQQGSVMAAYTLYKYYDGIRYSNQMSNQQKKLVENLLSDWSRKYERMKVEKYSARHFVSGQVAGALCDCPLLRCPL